MQIEKANLRTEAGLLIVDLQEGFCPRAGLVESIGKAASTYRVVVMTRFVNRPGSLYRSVLKWDGDGGALALNVKAAVILEKSGYGLPSGHIEVLRATNIREWHVCGLETDACVLACAFSLWDSGLVPVILRDLCDSPLHEEGLRIAQRQFGAGQESAVGGLCS